MRSINIEGMDTDMVTADIELYHTLATTVHSWIVQIIAQCHPALRTAQVRCHLTESTRCHIDHTFNITNDARKLVHLRLGTG